MNDRWFEITGLSEQQTLENKGALVAMHPDDRDNVGRWWADALATAQPAEIEYRLRTVTGDYRWHLARVVAARDESGNITRWVAAAFDIHDRRGVEDALRAAERRFETFFNLSSQPMAITRQSDGAFVNANAAFTDLTGFPRADVGGQTPAQLGMLDGAARIGAVGASTGGLGRHTELALRRNDGRRLSLVLSNADIEIDGVRCFVNAFTDLTQRRAMEDALRLSEADARARADELAVLMDAVPAAVMIAHDPECREVSGNRMAHEALTDIETEEGVPLDRLLLERAARGEELRNLEQELRSDDGQVMHLFGNAVALRDRDGAPRGAIVAFLDVTRLKQAEEALRRADRRKDEFLALLSHELRNPLTPILMSARLLERRVDAESRHDLDVIVRQVKHVARLVDDLLDVSRVARSAVTLSRTRIELASFAGRAVAATAPLFEERGHRLEIMVPAEGLEVEGDEVRLTQIVDNLLSNAARYTPPGGVVRMSGAREGESVVLSVRDAGIGIDPAMLPELFEIFVQGPRGSDRADGGLGIGLSLVKALTELHGGSVTAHSDGPGWGSTFTIRLPAAPPPGVAAPVLDVAPPPLAAASSKTRVLVVDDHRDVVDGLSRWLETYGCEVQAALTPAQALVIAETFQPHIAILDLGLPVMDGYTLAETLRARLGDAVPVLVALSGYSQPQDRERSSEAGFALHLSKPVDVDQLADALANVDVLRTRSPVG